VAGGVRWLGIVALTGALLSFGLHLISLITWAPLNASWSRWELVLVLAYVVLLGYQVRSKNRFTLTELASRRAKRVLSMFLAYAGIFLIWWLVQELWTLYQEGIYARMDRLVIIHVAVSAMLTYFYLNVAFAFWYRRPIEKW